jgi:ligand-binding sensor domain-containing protein
MLSKYLRCCLICLPLAINAQTWTNYTCGLITKQFVLDAQGNKWVATNNGICKFDGTTWTISNTSNSNIAGNLINSVTIDAQGNKWIGTHNAGISKFDGTTWTSYNTMNSELPYNSVKQIVVDSQNNKWFVTGEYWYGTKISKFNGTTWSHYPMNSITAIAFDAQNNLWVSSYWNGVYKFDGTSWTQYHEGNSPVNTGFNRITSITMDAQGNQWFGHDGGLTKFGSAGWISYTDRRYVRSVKSDAQNNTWISYGTNNCAKFDGLAWTEYYPNRPIHTFAFDTQGTLWATGDNTLLKWNGSTWENRPPYTPTVPFAELENIRIDTAGHKWFSVRGDEAILGKFDGNIVTLYDTTALGVTGQEANRISAIAVDAQNNKWLGMGYNSAILLKFDGTTATKYTVPIPSSSTESPRINTIVMDAQNNKWLGTQHGVYKFDGVNWLRYHTGNSGLPYDAVNAIAIDAQGHQWFATNRGVAEFDGTTWTRYPTTLGIRDDYTIHSISIDPQGNKWFGTHSPNVYKLTGNTWTLYTPHADSFLLKTSEVAFDVQGNPWVGLYGQGLWKFDGTNWTGYNALNSKLTSNYIRGLQMDAQDHKWVVGSYGFSKFNCAAALDFSVQMMKGDSAKPMINSTLPNFTTLLTGTRGNMTRLGTLGTNGKYRFRGAQTNAFQIKRNSLAVEGQPELDGMDAFQMNLVVTDHANATRSIPQLLAMDVNGDTKIDTADINALIQRSLNAQTGFKQWNRADTMSWRHFPKNYLTTQPTYRLSTTFPNNDGIGISRHQLPWIDSLFTIDSTYLNRCDTATLNFVGVLLGDADGNSFDLGTVAKTPLADTLIVFDGLNAIQMGQDTFKVPIYANQRMYGLGIKIANYNNSIQVLSISNGVEVRSEQKITAALKQCMMLSYSLNGNGIAPNIPLCYVTVKTNCPFPSQFGTMTAYLNGKLAKTQVTWNLCTPTDDVAAVSSVQVYPNPVAQQLTIDYHAAVKTLRIVNPLGQLVKSLEINDLGHLEVDISTLPKGVYFVQANKTQFVKFVKMDLF